VETAPGKVWIDQKVLERNDQAVPTERSEKPGQASSRQEHLVVRAKDRQSERRHVFECLAIKTVEFLVAAANFQHCPQPVRQALAMLVMMLARAFARRPMDALTVLQSVEQAAVPGLSGVQGDCEVEPTIGINRFGPTVRRTHHHSANKIAIAIAGSQPLPCLRPRGDDVPAAHDIVRLYFEN